MRDIHKSDRVLALVPGPAVGELIPKITLSGKVLEIFDDQATIRWDTHVDEFKDGHQNYVVENVPIELLTSGRLIVLDENGLPVVKKSPPGDTFYESGQA